MPDSRARFILFTPLLHAADIEACAKRVAEAAAIADVASLVLSLAPEVEDAALAPLLRLAEANDIALLVADDDARAARAGFDGAHVAGGAQALAAAIQKLRPTRIVGAGGLVTRDDAMSAGEAGADYVMFGETGPTPRALELVEWWAEVMQPNCAGFARTLDDVAAFADAGADFIALAPELWHGPEGIASASRRLDERAP